MKVLIINVLEDMHDPGNEGTCNQYMEGRMLS